MLLLHISGTIITTIDISPQPLMASLLQQLILRRPTTSLSPPTPRGSCTAFTIKTNTSNTTNTSASSIFNNNVTSTPVNPLSKLQLLQRLLLCYHQTFIIILLIPASGRNLIPSLHQHYHKNIWFPPTNPNTTCTAISNYNNYK